jgi:hypothetical protein
MIAIVVIIIGIRGFSVLREAYMILDGKSGVLNARIRE